jgi:hypothetical protein
MSFGFTELNGSYDYGTSTFTAVAVDDGIGGRLRTAGDVTRVIAPAATADYDDGFVSLGSSADFQLTMTLSNITPTSADVLANDGSFLIIDADGDTLTGNISGTWLPGAFGFLVFNGMLTNVGLSDNGNRDGYFNGPSGGLFEIDMAPAAAPFEGAILTLTAPVGHFFDQGGFTAADTLIEAQVLPGPAAMFMLVAGGLTTLRRRR